MSEKPANEYGEWTRGNVGQVGRCVTVYCESLFAPGEWIPMVAWEPHPDEPNDHKPDCHCVSCDLMKQTGEAA